MNAKTLYAAMRKDDNTDRWYLRDDIAADVREEAQEIIYATHNRMMVDDWRYRFVAEVAALLSEGSTLDNILNSDPDDVYPYTADRLAWVSSRLDRLAYVDDARREYDDGGDSARAIGLGMMRERDEVAYMLVSLLDEEE